MRMNRRLSLMMLLAIAAASAMAADAFLGEGIARFSRSDGLILLLFFFVFVYYTLGDLVAQRSEASRPEEDRSDTVDIHTAPGADSNFATSSDKPQDAPARRPRRDAFMIVVGIGGLLLGAQWTVDGGITVARAVGIPEVIVGLTMISIGTSLPELVATLAAVRRGELSIAIGGVVGSNIFNTLLVCGVTAVVRPIVLPRHGLTDLGFTALLTLALFAAARSHSRLILRFDWSARSYPAPRAALETSLRPTRTAPRPLLPTSIQRGPDSCAMCRRPWAPGPSFLY